MRSRATSSSSSSTAAAWAMAIPRCRRGPLRERAAGLWPAPGRPAPARFVLVNGRWPDLAGTAALPAPGRAMLERRTGTGRRRRTRGLAPRRAGTGRRARRAARPSAPRGRGHRRSQATLLHDAGSTRPAHRASPASRPCRFRPAALGRLDTRGRRDREGRREARRPHAGRASRLGRGPVRLRAVAGWPAERAARCCSAAATHVPLPNRADPSLPRLPP